MSRSGYVGVGTFVGLCLMGPASMIFGLAAAISLLAMVLFALGHLWSHVLIGAGVCVVGTIGFWLFGRVFIRLFNRAERGLA